MDRSEHEKTFHNWIANHSGLLFKVVRSFALASHDQDDLFQQISLQIWQSIPSYSDDVAVTTWLYRVAFYAANTWKRKENSRHRRTNLLGDADAVLLQPKTPVDPRLESLFKQLAELPELDRALVLMQLDGFSYREMAEVLGISQSNVGVRITRVKKSLSEKLTRGESHEV